MSLSLRMTTSRLPAASALFIASYAMPADIDPSPITAIALPGAPVSLLAIAKPSDALIEVDECAAPNGSYSLSLRLVKPLQPPALAQRADAVAPPGQDLVRIALVADVPHQPVGRRVEDIMDRDGQLDHAQPRAEMPAGGADRGDRLGAQFVGELAQLLRTRACAGRRGSSTVSSSGVSGVSDIAPVYRDARGRCRLIPHGDSVQTCRAATEARPARAARADGAGDRRGCRTAILTPRAGRRQPRGDGARHAAGRRRHLSVVESGGRAGRLRRVEPARDAVRRRPLRRDLREPRLLDPATEAARVRAMYTHPDFARRGVGRRMLAVCEAAARGRGLRARRADGDAGRRAAVPGVRLCRDRADRR